MKKCIHCAAEIVDNARFCAVCGKEQVKRYSQVFRRNGLSESDFIQKINNWFATYPQVADVTCKFGTGFGFGVLVNKRLLNSLSIEYRCLNGENKYQYGLVMLEKIGLVPGNIKKIVFDWMCQNPGAIVINAIHSANQRGSVGSLALGGFMATNRNQIYLFFKFDRAYGTVALPPKK